MLLQFITVKAETIFTNSCESCSSAASDSQMLVWTIVRVDEVRFYCFSWDPALRTEFLLNSDSRSGCESFALKCLHNENWRSSNSVLRITGKNELWYISESQKNCNCFARTNSMLLSLIMNLDQSSEYLLLDTRSNTNYNNNNKKKMCCYIRLH